MELIIIYLIASFVFNVVLGDKNKQKQKSRDKKNRKLRNNSKAIRPKKETVNQKGNKKRNSIFESLQDELMKIENELNEIDTERRRKMHSRDYIDKDLKEKVRIKDLKKSKNDIPSMSRMKGEVLSTERKISSMREEGYQNLATETISKNAQEEYRRSLYGSDEESPLFDYNYQVIDDREVSDEEPIEIFMENGKEIDLKKMVVIKEILDKPVALRD